MEECYERVLPYLRDKVVPSIREGKTVIIAAHNNVLRCIIKDIDDIPVASIRDIEVPKAVPIVYHLDQTTLKSVDPKTENGMSCISLGHELEQTHPEIHAPIPDPRDHTEFRGVPFSSVFTRQLLEAEAQRLNIEPHDFPAYVNLTEAESAERIFTRRHRVASQTTIHRPSNLFASQTVPRTSRMQNAVSQAVVTNSAGN